jgi:hypothetical protein
MKHVSCFELSAPALRQRHVKHATRLTVQLQGKQSTVELESKVSNSALAHRPGRKGRMLNILGAMRYSMLNSCLRGRTHLLDRFFGQFPQYRSLTFPQLQLLFPYRTLGGG